MLCGDINIELFYLIFFSNLHLMTKKGYIMNSFGAITEIYEI